MEHIAWKGRIKPGCKAEYQRRHAEIWPEMVKVLKDAGICNYSIFYCNDELFGYYECEKGVAYAEKVQAESPVVDQPTVVGALLRVVAVKPMQGAGEGSGELVLQRSVDQQVVGCDAGLPGVEHPRRCGAPRPRCRRLGPRSRGFCRPVPARRA